MKSLLLLPFHILLSAITIVGAVVLSIIASGLAIRNAGKFRMGFWDGLDIAVIQIRKRSEKGKYDDEHFKKLSPGMETVIERLRQPPKIEGNEAVQPKNIALLSPEKD